MSFFTHSNVSSLDKLEPAASNLLNLKNKLRKSLLSTSLGSTIMLTLILKASLETGKSNNNMNTWSLLAQSLLTSVAEGVKLGAFLVQFNLAETTLANLLSLDNKLKPAWLNLMVRIKTEVSFTQYFNHFFSRNCQRELR